MKIDLSWVNRNVGDEGTRIYRSESPIQSDSLPEPLATVGPGVTAYSDTNVVRNKTYYYRFEVYKGNDKALSNQVTVTANPLNGPGPQTLIMGDYEAGYFGKLTSSEFFTAEEVAYYSGLTAGSVLNNTTEWFKFAYKGKILFIPAKVIRYNMSWQNLYEKGLVYGTDDNGNNVPTAITIPVNQLKYITKNGENFKVRLMKGSPSNPITGSATGTYDSVGFQGSEWDELIYKMVTQVPVNQRGGNWSDAAVTTVLDNQYFTLCQEAVTDGTVLYRGYSNAYIGHAGRVPHTFTSGTNLTLTGGNVSGSQYTGWRPVLEWYPAAI